MDKSQSHPKGLYLLFVTEMWERFSFYGMRALFTLFMVNALLLDTEHASKIYGSYLGLVYLTPLIGGYVSDKYWGNRRSILVGGILMAIGQLFMFGSASLYTSHDLSYILMMAGLTFLIIGNGFFKPNISTMVGDLYEPADKRKDSAFTIFYMGINLGAFIAPLVCGFLGDTGNPDSYKWGFLCAAIGMIVGIFVFELLKNKYICTPDGRQIGLLPARDFVHHKKDEKIDRGASPKRVILSVASIVILFFLFSFNFSGTGGMFADVDWVTSGIFSVSIVVPFFIISDPSLTKIERSRIWVIYIVAFFVIFFWASFEQAGSALTVFADKQTNRSILGWTMPASYFQSFNPIFILILAPIFAALWQKLGKHNHEPSSPMKQSIGLFLLALGYLIIALGVKGVNAEAKVSMIWLTLMYMTHTMGELSLSPIGLSLVSKLSPARLGSLLMGVWFMSTAAANKFAGILSGCYPYNINADGSSTLVSKQFWFYHINDLYDFFMLFVVMSGVAAVILFFLSSKLQKMMRGIE